MGFVIGIWRKIQPNCIQNESLEFLKLFSSSTTTATLYKMYFFFSIWKFSRLRFAERIKGKRNELCDKDWDS